MRGRIFRVDTVEDEQAGERWEAVVEDEQAWGDRSFLDDIDEDEQVA